MDGLALHYNEVAEELSAEDFVQISSALTKVKGVTVADFADQIGLPEDLVTQWLAGETVPDCEFRKMILDKLFQFARGKIHPCSPKYQYPGATIHEGWVLPVGVTLRTKLSALPGWKGLTVKYQQMFAEINVNTVGEYLSDPEAPRQINSIGWSRNNTIKTTLLTHSGFRKIDQKLLSAS